MKPNLSETGKIVLYGASVRAAAQSAAAAGWSVIGVDWFGDVDARAACEQFFTFQELQSSDAWTTFRRSVGNIPRLQVGGIDDLRIDLVEQTDPAMDFQATPIKRLRIGKEPIELQEFCDGLPISCPLSFGSIDQWRQRDSNAQISGQEIRQRWILKPRGGSGGANIRWIDWTEVESANFEKFFVQSFIEGTVHGATCVGDGERSWVVGSCQSIVQSLNDQPFSYSGSIGPLQIDSSVQSSLDQIADRYVLTSKCRGMFNIDYILDSDGQPWLIEINDRLGASTELIEAAAGVSLVDRAIRLLYRQSIPWKDFQLRYSNTLRKRILYADADQRFDLATIQRLNPKATRICDLPADHTLVKSDSPLCTVIEPFQKESSFREPNGPK
jgi:uncharacterized protein